MGHLMRSLVYAKNFTTVLFASKSNEKAFLPYRVMHIEDEEEFFDHIESLRPRRVVVDNYDFSLEHEKEFKKRFPDIRLVVFDDDYREHCCDEIVNHNICADKSRYPNPNIVTIIPPLIREEFVKIAKRRQRRKKGVRLFISMGGVDRHNYNLQVAKVLSHLRDIEIVIATTSANKNIKTLRRYAKGRKNIHLHVDSKEIARLMGDSDIVITAPSTMLAEALFLRVPFIAIKTADNQTEMAAYLKKHHLALLEGLNKTRFLVQFKKLKQRRRV